MNKKFYILTLFLFTMSNLFGADDGLANYKNKKYAESKAYYEQLLSQDEENSAAALGLGASLYQLGDAQNAAKSFEDAVKSEDKSIQEIAFYNLGNSIYSQQRPKESLAFYRKALELNPNDDDAKFNYELAKYLSDQQQQDQEQQQDQNQQNEQNNQNDQNEQNDDQQDTDKDEPDKQEDKDSDSSEDEQRNSPKTQKQINAEAILDALKDEEKIHQKVKMAQQSGRKHEKDW